MTTQKCRRGNYIIEQIEVVLDVVVQIWQVGAHFKALIKLESVVPLVLPCIFFTSQTRPPAHCAVTVILQGYHANTLFKSFKNEPPLDGL